MADLTHILTQNGKGLGGIGGADSAGDHRAWGKKGPESTAKQQLEPFIVAHNPEVVGSNPTPATKKVPYS